MDLANTFTKQVSTALFVLLVTVQFGFSQSKPAPFSPQRSGGISLQDVIKLTSQSPLRDSTTNEDLGKIKTNNVVNYGREFTRPEKTQLPPRTDLYASSKILNLNGKHTVVPRHSVLHVPPNLKRHLSKTPEGPLVFWPQFVSENQKLLTLQEVSLKNASGETPIPEEISRNVERAIKIVVAVYKGYPISVLAELNVKSKGKEEGVGVRSETKNRKFKSLR